MNKVEARMMNQAVIEVDGVAFVEVAGARHQCRPEQTGSYVAATCERQGFIARMDNWRRVVHGTVKPSGHSQYCAGWAKLYVHLRTSEAAPPQDLLEEKIKPLTATVSARTGRVAGRGRMAHAW
jgi:hypothetical protein